MWPSVSFKTHDWERGADELALIPKSRRRKTPSVREAANSDRAGSASHRLPALLVEQPVVNVAHVASRLGITDRAARSLVETACERGILSKVANTKRGAFYQAGALIAVLEEASSIQGVRRMASR